MKIKQRLRLAKKAGMQIMEVLNADLKPKDIMTKEAFENAIKNGLETPEDYMYMYSIGKNDYFKHMITRKYRCIERQIEKSE